MNIESDQIISSTKKVIILIILIVISCSSKMKGQDLYDINVIRSINLNFYDQNWDQILDSFQSINSEERVLADLTIDGTTYDSIGVRFKGNSSYRHDRIKNPFNLKIDYIRDQNIFGYTTLKLSNMFKDPSCVREVLSYEILRNYIPASKSNYILVYIDNQIHGLYTNNESVNSDFVKSHFGSDNNSFFKCDPITITGNPQPPPPGCLPVQGISSTLVEMGNDTSCYKQSYEIKSDNEIAWIKLENLIIGLNQNPDSVYQFLDIDKVLWMNAFNNIFVNFDSYLGSGHNYYIYEGINEKFNPIIWDLNENFGVFKNGGQGPLNLSQMQQLSTLWNKDNVNRPLVSQLLLIPDYRNRYYAHFRTIVKEFLANGNMKARAIQLQELIDSFVLIDPNKLYTYSDFNKSLDQNVGFGQGEVYGINVLMDARYTHLSNHQVLTKQGPVIANVQQSSTEPMSSDSVWITCDINNVIQATLAYKVGKFSSFLNQKMFDDGMHNDGQASDGTFGGLIPAQIPGAEVCYYIYAVNPDACMFSPEKAEHEFYSYNVKNDQNAPGDLVINEFMASNTSSVYDQDDEYDDWVELYNNSSQDIQLAGMKLSDDLNDPGKWIFPNSNIKANSFLIIWTDGDTTQNGLHTNFKLSKDGEDIVLTDMNGITLDQLSFPLQSSDISYGRYPNGTGTFGFMNHSFNSTNTDFLNINEIIYSSKIRAYPNPCSGILTLEIPNSFDVNKEIIITDMVGKILLKESMNKNAKDPDLIIQQIDISKFENGLYCLIIYSKRHKYFIKILKSR